MIDSVRIATRLYAGLIRLFPGEFQCNFDEELRGVFRSMAKDAVDQGGTLELIRVCLQELRDLPGNILHEHLDSLRKAFGRNRIAELNSPSRSAGWGALGFGLGFGLLIVLRWLLDPQNNIMFTNFGLGLMRETVLFGLMATLGSVMIGRSIFSPMFIKRIAIASLLFGGLGGLLATSFTSFSYNVFSAQLHAIHSLGILVQFTGALIYGAFLGIVFGFLDEHRERFIHMVSVGSACFGVSFLISEGVFRLFYLLPVSRSWMLEYWVIPLAAAMAIEGLIGGALLGWVVAKEKPSQPTRLAANIPAGIK